MYNIPLKKALFALAEYNVGPEYGRHPASDGASECGSDTSSTSDCPDEFYNLTKLAEVSLAAAAGTLVHPLMHGLERHDGPEDALKFDAHFKVNPIPNNNPIHLPFCAEF